MLNRSINIFMSVVGAGLLLSGCRTSESGNEAMIQFTKLPPAGEGSPFKVEAIEGTVTGAGPGQRIVLFARAGVWWVQPLADKPFTPIVNSKWRGTTHPGNAYAALLVNSEYKPPLTAKVLPDKGGSILAVAVAESAVLAQPVAKVLKFGGYEWELRQTASEPGGSRNLYSPENVFVDSKGFLHLQIVKRDNVWTSAEVKLTRSLGYGSYSFVVSDTSQFEPAAVLNLSVWDNSGPPREMDIELSRWGELNSKNAQYVIQPFYIPANVFRFVAPPGVLTYRFSWDPGRATFTTMKGLTRGTETSIVASHSFTSGIPSPGTESIHMNLYVFDNKKNPLTRETEVVIEKFEYLP